MRKVFFLFTVVIMFYSCTSNPFVGIGNDKDVEYPKLNIQSPRNTDYIGRNFNIKGVVSDDKGISRVVVSCPGLPTISYPTGGAINIPVDASPLNDGPIKLTIEAFDTSGKRSSIDLSLTLDKNGPIISLYQPENVDGKKLVGPINFIGNASDDTGLNHLSPLNRFVIYKRDGSPDNSSDIVLNHSLNSVPFEIKDSFDTMRESHIAGLYNLRITYVDILGNLGEKIWEIETIKGDDKTRLYVQSPINNSAVGILMTLSGYATNEFVDIATINYKIYKESDTGHILVEETVDCSYEFSKIINLQTAGLSTSKYIIHTVATDQNGNTSNDVFTTFDFDNSLPVFTMTDVSSDVVGITPKGSSTLGSNFGLSLKVVTPSPTSVQYKVLQNGVEKVAYSPATNIPQKSGEIYEINGISVASLSDGSVTLYAKVVKGEKTAELNRTFYLDKTNPNIQILSHSDNQHINGSLIINGSADDNLGLSTVKIQLPDTTEWKNVSGTSIWSYEVANDEINSIEGIYNITKPNTSIKEFKVKATDKAGNEKITTVSLVIDPAQDYPTVSILMPSINGVKVSGMLSVIGTIDDDDYPTKDMSATMWLKKVSDSSLVAGYPKTFDKMTNGFPNISSNINTEELEDMTQYRIELQGASWKNKTSALLSKTFQVDKNVPIIEFDPDSAKNEDYLTNSIRFKGKVKDKGQLAASDKLMITFVIKGGATKSYPVLLTTSAPSGGYNVWTFDLSLNSNGTHTGFVTAPTAGEVSWGNDEYGNNPRIFTFRATDETALAGYAFIKVNLDNNKPIITITNPVADYVIVDNSPLIVNFNVNDVPGAGKEYELKFVKNVKIELYKDSVLVEPIIKEYGAGSNDFTLTASNTYNMPQTLAQSNNYQLRMYVKDNAGNESLVSSVNFRKNSEPPSVKSIVFDNLPYHRGTFDITVVGEDRGTVVGGNGVKNIKLFIKNSSGVETKLKEASFGGTNISETLIHSFNSTSQLDGSYTVYAAVTDTLDTEVYEMYKSIYIDNAKPTSSITYQSMGETASSDPEPITAFTAYFGFKVTATDNASLMGDTPKVKVGTTSGGDNVLAETFLNPIMNGALEYTATYNNWIDLFEVLGTNYGTTPRLYITVETKDVAGNIGSQEFIINKGTLPTGIFAQSELHWYKPTAGNVSINGTVGAATKAFMKIGNGSEKELTLSESNFSSSYNSTEFGSGGPFVFKLRVTKGGDQNVISRTFNIDTETPTVSITEIVPKTPTTGNVDGNKISGLVTIKGKYNDNFADKLTNLDAAGIKLTIGSTNNLSPTRITRGYAGVDWLWEYDWNTETDSSVTRNNVGLSVDAVDIAGNTITYTRPTPNINVVPYITSITASGITDLVTDVRTNNGGVWSNHKANKKYSVEVGKTVKINGFNLKQGTTNPTLTLGGTSITASGFINVITTGNITKSGNLALSVNGIAADTVYIYAWSFDLLGRGGTNQFDTFDAENYDMDLLSNNKVIAVFARNHLVDPGYTTYNEDYSAYKFVEGQAGAAYRYFGAVDPVFYASIVRYDDTYSYSTSTYDEWTGGNYTQILRLENNAGASIGYNITGPRLQNENKSGAITLSTNKERIYVAYYNDGSREITPLPTLTFRNTAINTGGAVVVVDSVGNPGEFLDTKSVNNRPYLLYYKSGTDRLYIARNTVSDTSSTLTTQIINDVGGSTAVVGGRYCKMAVSGTNLHIVYQDSSSNLKYAYMAATANSFSSNITLESESTYIENAREGITGFNTSITLNGVNPYVTYMNNSKLETREALRFAYSTGTSPFTADKWEYMIIPSSLPVNNGNTIIKIDSTSKPVIMYKANNRLYIARLK